MKRMQHKGKIKIMHLNKALLLTAKHCKNLKLLTERKSVTTSGEPLFIAILFLYGIYNTYTSLYRLREIYFNSSSKKREEAEYYYNNICETKVGDNIKFYRP